MHTISVRSSQKVEGNEALHECHLHSRARDGGVDQKLAIDAENTVSDCHSVVTHKGSWCRLNLSKSYWSFCCNQQLYTVHAACLLFHFAIVFHVYIPYQVSNDRFGSVYRNLKVKKVEAYQSLMTLYHFLKNATGGICKLKAQTGFQKYIRIANAKETGINK